MTEMEVVIFHNGSEWHKDFATLREYLLLRDKQIRSVFGCDVLVGFIPHQAALWELRKGYTYPPGDMSWPRWRHIYDLPADKVLGWFDESLANFIAIAVDVPDYGIIEYRRGSRYALHTLFPAVRSQYIYKVRDFDTLHPDQAPPDDGEYIVAPLVSLAVYEQKRIARTIGELSDLGYTIVKM